MSWQDALSFFFSFLCLMSLRACHSSQSRLVISEERSKMPLLPSWNKCNMATFMITHEPQYRIGIDLVRVIHHLNRFGGWEIGNNCTAVSTENTTITGYTVVMVKGSSASWTYTCRASDGGSVWSANHVAASFLSWTLDEIKVSLHRHCNTVGGSATLLAVSSQMGARDREIDTHTHIYLYVSKIY